MDLRIVACGLLAAALSAPQLAAAANTVVHMVTTLGTIDIQLYDDQAPLTVTNFLRYAGRGDYSANGIDTNGTIIHRSIPTFVIQGGGYSYFDLGVFGLHYFHITEDPPVPNEFSPSRSNLRGTITMAKIDPSQPGGGPDSATSEWFINLADNGGSPSTNPPGLDYQNGGFTVFGNVIDTPLDPGMSVVDAIANVQVWNASSVYPPFDNLPLINYNSTTPIQASNLVLVTSIPNVTATRTQTDPVKKTTSAYAADIDVTLSNPNTNRTVDPNTSDAWLKTFTPPSGKAVQFNDEISQFTMTWTTGPASRVVTLYHGAATNVNGYYAYGPTSDNPTPHWYDFSYDGTTGAEIVGNKVLLHFVDGQRGDDDLAVNGSITHTGAPILVTDIPTSSPTSVGCSIAATPSQMRGNSDWIVVSMFLAFVALVRRRQHRDRTEATRH